MQLRKVEVDCLDYDELIDEICKRMNITRRQFYHYYEVKDISKYSRNLEHVLYDFAEPVAVNAVNKLPTYVSTKLMGIHYGDWVNDFIHVYNDIMSDYNDRSFVQVYRRDPIGVH